MLQCRGRVELRGLFVVLRSVLVFISCRAVATAYSSAIGVGCAIAAASVRVRLGAVSCLRLAVRVSAVLLVILRHSRSVLGWIDCVGAMLSGRRSGASRQMRKLRNRGLTSAPWADDKGGAEMLISSNTGASDGVIREVINGAAGATASLFLMWVKGKLDARETLLNSAANEDVTNEMGTP
jgi:hypothetical protein